MFYFVGFKHTIANIDLRKSQQWKTQMDKVCYANKQNLNVNKILIDVNSSFDLKIQDANVP